MGGGAERTDPRRRSMPCPTGRPGWSASSRCWSSRSRVGVRLAGDRVFALERGGGQKQFALVVRPAGRSAARRRGSLVDPAAPGRRRHRGDRLVPPLARRRSWSPTGSRRAATSAASSGCSTSPPGQHRADEIPDTRAASVAWLPGEHVVPLRPLPRRRSSTTAGSSATSLGQAVDRGRAGLGRPADPRDVGRRRGVARRSRTCWSRRWSAGPGPTCTCCDAATGDWRTLISGIEATTDARFDGDRLRRPSPPSTPPAAGSSPSRSTTTAEPDGVDDAGARGRRRHAARASRWPAACSSSRDGLRRGACRRTTHRDGGSASARSRCPSCARWSASTRTGRTAPPSSSSRASPGPPASSGGTGRWSHGAGARCGPRGAADVGRLSNRVHRGARAIPLRATAPRSGCSSCTAPTRARTPTRRASSPATAASPSPRRRRGRRPSPAWAEAGGLFAVAGLRGGYEEGEAWHQAGRREHKQNVFDDFHAAADHLVATGRTARDRLAIRGGSNGGLLVGAALTQRPDLCRAVHCARPAARHGALPAVPHRPAVDATSTATRSRPMSSPGCSPTRRTTTSVTASATRPCS